MSAMNVDITICDSDRTQLTILKDQYQVRNATTKFSDILSDKNIQGVILATPSQTHFPMAREILLSGKDVLIEKPMTLEYHESVELHQLANQMNLILMVGHVFRYNAAVIKLKELIQLGSLGDIRYAYSTRLNMGIIRNEENVLMNSSPHDVSIILNLMGELPISVSATGGAYLQPGIADFTSCTLNFNDDKKALIFVSWLYPAKERKLVVVGSRKMAVFDDIDPIHKLVTYDNGLEYIDGKPVAHMPPPETVTVDNTEPLRIEDAHFLECINTRNSPVTDGAEALRVMSVLQACQESLDRNGESVTVKIGSTSKPQSENPDS